MQIMITFISGACQRYCFLAIIILYTLLFSTLCSVANCDLSQTNITDGTKSWNYTALDRLRLQVFTNYDKNAHPTTHGMPTNITLSMSVNYVDIDELDGKIVVHAWLKIRWLDEERVWNYKDYDNITQIHMPANSVWKPQITLFNSAGDGTENYMGETGVLLAHDGSLLWVPPVLYTAYCALNLLKWPYDEQVCHMKIGSWSQTNIEPYIESRNDGLDYNELVQSTEWEIIRGQVKFVTKDYYNYMEFKFNLRRRSSMYYSVIYTPASCIILLNLATFWLPPQMGEKIMLNSVIIVIVAAFLMYFAQLLPILATNTPLIVLFYSSTLMLLSISTIIAVVVLYISTAQHRRRVPEPIRYVLNGPVGSILLLKHFTLESDVQSSVNGGTKELSENLYDTPDNDSLADPLSINPNPVSRSIQFDWILLATAVDRIFFVLYCLVYLAFAILYEI